MTNRDRGIVAVLGALLVVLAIAVGLPGASSETAQTQPSARPSAEPSASVPPPGAADVVYREGTVGRPSSINPLTARTQADRDLVSLIFSGLVALGPDGTYRPDLASGWTVDDKGKTWTFTIRDDATWHDGEPVTAADVVFTVDILKNPSYTGPLAASWREVSATAVDDKTVKFELKTPIGGFLQAATVGLLPAHLLSQAPVETLADDPFNLQPVGSGPFVLVSWNAESASLVPASAADTPAVDPSVAPDPTPDATAADASAAPDPSSSSPVPGPSARTPTDQAGDQLPGIEMSFFPDAPALADAYRAGGLDAASGLPPDLANQLAALPGDHLLKYPRTTLTAIALNLRPGNGELRTPLVRHGLLAAIDRTALIDDVFGGAATRADSLVPPSSWAFDQKSSKAVKFNLKQATADFKAAGWKHLPGGWAVAGSKKPYQMELISPDKATNPTAMAAAEAVAAAWRKFGLQTTVTGLPPAEFVQERLRAGKFQAAAIDVNIGLDPDLYPLLASTQVTKGGSNFTGIQDVNLDRDLIHARAPGTDAARKAAYAKLQARLASKNYILPLAFRDELVVMSDRLSGPVIRELGDPSDRFWDVLSWRLAGGG